MVAREVYVTQFLQFAYPFGYLTGQVLFSIHFAILEIDVALQVQLLELREVTESFGQRTTDFTLAEGKNLQ